MSDDPRQRRRDGRDRVKARAEALAYTITLLRAFRADEDPNDENAFRFFTDIPYWNRLTCRVGDGPSTWIDLWIDEQVEALQLENYGFETWQEYQEYLNTILRLDTVDEGDETEPPLSRHSFRFNS